MSVEGHLQISALTEVKSAYPQERTSSEHQGMSALCHKQKGASLFDHLVRAAEQGRRDVDAELFRRLEIDYQFELGGLHNR